MEELKEEKFKHQSSLEQKKESENYFEMSRNENPSVIKRDSELMNRLDSKHTDNSYEKLGENLISENDFGLSERSRLGGLGLKSKVNAAT